jgi:hypothetical protein
VTIKLFLKLVGFLLGYLFDLPALHCTCPGVCAFKIVSMSYLHSSKINARALFMGLGVCEFTNGRLVPRDTEPSSIAGSRGVLVYSILSHKKATHQRGLYKAWVSILIFSITSPVGCLTSHGQALVDAFGLAVLGWTGGG